MYPTSNANMLGVFFQLGCFYLYTPQVMGLRMLIDENGYQDGTDTEGGAMADRINAQLPPEVCVFAVQKVEP